MPTATGEKVWIIPDGYIPEHSSGTLTSHESICVLNTASEDAHLTITIFFEDRDPLENIAEVVAARRTKHIRTSSLAKEGTPIPVGVPYAIEVKSDIPVIVQYSRLDATQAENALMSVIAYPIK
ncbi:sensory rhodopsin transducer [Paenibacillus doosanensis]|uniref:Sensory rhodopsin transducer n=1 Tax=Paenibacillus konkukensis TaxID=2020716 RepID=A0ABY4RGS6_9BACL|nr:MULTISPECIES: sensory rhodopsin transducer [Paenibacillus]MCS7460548.1 sensory rhodopsin transducer [Paenibacillus doosanensis]UQZ81230.1 Anabaena sensory rhodopsin transducer [Paenibacillus konkukensis]